MLSEERHRAIVSAIRRSGAATVAVLSADLQVSEATIRRDLDVLAEQGLVRRVRGGATDPRGSVRPEADPRSFADVAANASNGVVHPITGRGQRFRRSCAAPGRVRLC